MKRLAALILCLLPLPLWACDTPICQVDPNSLALPEQITFENAPSGAGPGLPVEGILALAGARFGERFAGQALSANGAHDLVSGPPYGPLTLMAGVDGQNLSVVRFMGISVLNGYGAAGFPKRDAQGEGAIAILFDRDQSGLTIDLRGGEAGAIEVQFFRRDGSVLARMPIRPVGEFALGFMRMEGAADIAGLVLTNTDPQGVAIDTIRFGKTPDLS